MATLTNLIACGVKVSRAYDTRNGAPAHRKRSWQEEEAVMDREERMAMRRTPQPVAAPVAVVAVVAAPVARCFPLPWDLCPVRRPSDIVGQAAALEKVRSWLRAPTPMKLFPRATLVLQGPPGCGKTSLLRACAEEARMAMVELGPHVAEDLARFLRRLGSVDCTGRRTCCLVDDLPQVMETQRTTEALKVLVS